MRATVGMIGIGLCLVGAIAAAQTPGSAATPQRRATLLAPQPVYNPEGTLARAAADDLPILATTPVTRPVTRAGTTSGPGWLNGTDASVRPAAGINTSSPSRPLPQRDSSSYLAKSFDRVKDALGSGDRAPENGRAPGTLPGGVANSPANASTAFRGTSATGATVYAGPPAYRWYGWGSVTPGANPYAPTGQFPLASANWFTITGATPGAFPVPVMNPYRPAPGTEPPAYVVIPNRRVAPASASSIPVARMHSEALPPRMPSSFPPPADVTIIDVPTASRVVQTPTPTIAPPPPIVVPGPAMPTLPETTEPPIRSANVRPALLPMPTTNVMDPPAASQPTPLPVSVTEDKTKWQPNSGPNAPDNWSPAGGKRIGPQ